MSQPHTPDPRESEPVILTLLKAPIKGFNHFILSDLRDGRLSFSGLSFPLVVTIVFGFITLFAAVALTLALPTLRSQLELLSLQSLTQDLRGSTIPKLVIPLVIFLLSVAWGFLLAGTIRSGRWVRILILFLYYSSIFTIWLTTFFNLFLNWDFIVIINLLLSFISLIAIPIFMRRQRKRDPQPALEFCVLFILSLLNIQLNQAIILGSNALLGDAGASLLVDAYLANFTFIVLPFFLQIGMEIAKFVRKSAFWSSEILYFEFPQRLKTIYIALAAITIIQIVNVIRNTVRYFQQNTLSNALLGYVGAASILLIVWIVWSILTWINGRNKVVFQHDDQLDDALDWMVIPATLLTINIGIVLQIILLAAPLFIIPTIWFDLGQDGNIYIFEAFDKFSSNALISPALAAGISLIWGIWLIRKKQLLSSCFIILFGTFFLWGNLVKPDQPFALISWVGDDPVDFWWSIFLLSLLLYWLWKKELTTQRAISLLILSLINTLIFRQTDFIEEPLYRVLEFTGVGLVAFGICWDTLTVGSWANESSPNLPRESRIYLYLGYVILAVTVIIWAIGQHNHDLINQFTGEGALNGLKRMGRPMLYMLYPLLLTLPKDQLPIKKPAKKG